VARITHATLDLLYTTRAALLRRQWFTSKILPAIPRPLRWSLRRLYFLPSDLADRFSGNSGQLLPPKSRIFTGSVDNFKTSGEAVARRLVEYAGLLPTSTVLDVGCGIGRVAIPLTEYLTESGRYEGLDIVPDGISWCNENITPRYPNFRFSLADVYNKEYHPHGKAEAKNYRFPYADNTFDVVILTSVFTHMLPAEVENYMSEIVRVLKPNARCYITHLLIDDISRVSMEAGHSDTLFKHHIPPYWLVDDKIPELSVGYDLTYVRELHARHGLDQDFRVLSGTWSGRPLEDPTTDFSQDIVLATLNKVEAHR
jgi:ubiquinone/menaquinone biosynthesis C-methylase UbiE